MLSKWIFFVRVFTFIFDVLFVCLAINILGSIVKYDFWANESLCLFIVLMYFVIGEALLNGQTLGKFISKIEVRSSKDHYLMDGIIRNLTKVMYIIPLIGSLAIMANLMLYIKKGRFLHDVISSTHVGVKKWSR